MNELLKTTKTHLREILKHEGVKTGVRSLLHAKDVLIKGKSDKMLQEHGGAIATEQPKFKMILGVTNMGKRQHRKKGAKNPEVVNIIDEGKWRDALMDDVKRDISSHSRDKCVTLNHCCSVICDFTRDANELIAESNPREK